jgi:hypothetical protein
VLVLVRVNPPNVVESRALTRLIFENFFFLSALCEKGADFVRAMRSDEAANRKALGEFAFKKLTDEDKGGGHGLIIRTQIRKLLDEFPKPTKFSVKGFAAETVADTAYLSYAILSMDAHPSVTSLQRHLQWEPEGDTHHLTITVVPAFAPKERHQTCTRLALPSSGFALLLINCLAAPPRATACVGFLNGLKLRSHEPRTLGMPAN